MNGERLPVYVADYVLTDYGTGAIMAVPAHDQRDFDFARAFDLPIRQVVKPADGEVDETVAYLEHSEGEVLVNSGEFDGLPAPEGGRRIVENLAGDGRGQFTVNYRLRDWGFSRQRYWGCPIPVVYCGECGIVPVPDDQLPVILPEIEDYKPKGVPPLAQAEDWVNVSCPSCGGPAKREVETMDTFVDSSWYFLRYCDPHNETAPFDRAAVDYWNPVDLYIGGVDHATVHMIYARFWIKVLNDMGLVGFREPFAAFYSNGWVTLGKTKMSKRAGNIVGPDDFLERYGADACRLNILFLGPADEDMEWTETSVEAMSRFVKRLWNVVNEVVETAPVGEPENGPLAKKAHATIAKVTDDIGRRFAFNTRDRGGDGARQRAVEGPGRRDSRFAAETAVSLIQPYAPHVGRGAVVAARARAAVGGALAGRRPGDARGRDGRGGRPGEREDPRPAARVAVHRRGRARRARARVGARAGAAGRRRGVAHGRRSGQARQLRDLVAWGERCFPPRAPCRPD